MSVCLLAYLRNNISKLHKNLHVTSSFSEDNAIRYVLPVLWMTSCFHVMGQINIEIKATGELFNITRHVLLGTKSALAVCRVLSCDHEL